MCVIVEVAAAPPIDSRMWVEIDWIMLAGVFFCFGELLRNFGGFLLSVFWSEGKGVD